MGCVSSSLLSQDDELSHSLGHHIVSLTSTTYGLLTLDPPSRSQSPSSSPASSATTTTTTTTSSRPPPEVINSWELMAGLDSNDSFRFSPLPLSTSSSSNNKPGTPKFFSVSKSTSQDRENRDPNKCRPFPVKEILLTSKTNNKPLLHLGEEEVDQVRATSMLSTTAAAPLINNNYYSLDGFHKVCPVPVPNNWDNKVVLYTTTLRGVRLTFEACNAVRSALQSLGFSFSERDISMDRGFRDELNQLRPQQIRSNSSLDWAPPRLFIKGRYIGGADEVLKIHDQGALSHLLQGIPNLNPPLVCDGCGGFTFLPCFRCHGSCKLVMLLNPHDQHQFNSNKVTTHTVVIRCPDCNENGLVLCPICT